MRRTSPSSDKVLTAETLNRVDFVDVYTDSGLIGFYKISNNGARSWKNTVKNEYVSRKKMLDILKGYQSAGCLVMPLTGKDAEPDVRDIEIPEDCYRMALLGHDGYVLKIFDRRGKDEWEPSTNWDKYTTAEALQYFVSKMRDHDLETAVVTFMFRGSKKNVNKIVSIPV